MTEQAIQTDKSAALLSMLAILGVSLFLQQEFQTKQAVLFLIGIGLGVSLMHAAYGFTGSWKQFILKRRSLGIRGNVLLLVIVSVLFFPILGQAFGPVQVSAALGPVGLSVVIGAFIFGIGMQLGGGCGSGTLYTFGQGQVDMLVTLVFFIVGATIGSAHLHWWMDLPNLGKISLIKSMGWLPALLLQLAVLAAIYWLVSQMEKKRYGKLAHIITTPNQRPFIDRLIHGPWPLWWGLLGLGLFSLLTLLVAGHPWSITFAFGLWGAKIWSVLGGDPSLWPYWSGGYPARALNSSVLADTTSLMDFGLIIGALLAAALAGKFAPAGPLKWNRAIAAILGGLLLGYGARLAFGCNIGAMLAGISTGSLHGWVWLVFGFSGNLVGVRLRLYFDSLNKS